MSTIVYQTDRNGRKYAYESTSYWDKDKKAPRSKRKYIGRVDPDTGEIIPPRGKRDTHDQNPLIQPDSPPTNIEADRLRSELDRKEKELEALKGELADMRGRYNAAMAALSQIQGFVSDALGGASSKDGKGT